MSTSLIQLKNVTMKFGGVTALSDVTFDVKNQEILGLIGPNGAGKTTLCELLSNHFEWEVNYESTDDNPYLEDF